MELRTFQELNQDGCNYGWIWPTVNEAAVTAATRYGLVAYNLKNKVQIVSIVLAVMDSLNKAGVLKLPVKDVKDYIMKSPAFLEMELRSKPEKLTGRRPGEVEEVPFNEAE